MTIIGLLRRVGIAERLYGITLLGGLALAGGTGMLSRHLGHMSTAMVGAQRAIALSDRAHQMQLALVRELAARERPSPDTATIQREAILVRTIAAGLQASVQDTVTNRLLNELLAASATLDHDRAMGYVAFATIDRIVERMDADRELDREVAAIARGRTDTVVFVGLLLIVLTGVSALVARSIIQPINHHVAALQRVAAGDHSHRVTVTGRDEVTTMSEALNTTIEAFRHTEDELVQTSERSCAISASLESTEGRMRFALQAARVGIWEADLLTGVSHWSDVCEVMHGIPVGSFGQTFGAFIDRIAFEDQAAVHQAIAEATRNHTDAHLEYRTIWPDGTTHWIQSTGRIFYDAANKPIRAAGVSIDITERRALEAQFRQAQKMEAIGQLAGAVAHDFNNLLTAILVCGTLIEESLEPDDARRKEVADIQRATERAAALTKQLLAFSRKQVMTMETLRVGEVVDGIAPMIRRLLGETVELRTEVADACPVRADPGQLEQVLMNLIVNARDAMPDGGRVTVETADVWLDEEYAQHKVVVRPGPYVLLAVSDTGLGMSAETQQRIFEPFFTTKGLGKGTGLGLATVYGIVKQFNGFIWVYSELGRGTTFKVYLPRTDQAVAAPAQAISQRPVAGTESIVLVEDEESLRELAERLLTRQGYQVESFPTPTAAIAYADEHFEPIDLILTDVVLPEMTGRAMATRIQTRHPEARVLYVSGYTHNAIDSQGVLDEGTWFLQKPFTVAGLTAKVREVLDTGFPERMSLTNSTG